MKTSFFYTKATSLKADLKRHDEKIKALKEHISRLEETAELTPMQEVALELYKELLVPLLDSRDRVAAKIGKA